MQAKVIAGPPQIISVAFQGDALLGGDWFRPAMRTAEALALCCSTRETSASEAIEVGLLAGGSSTRIAVCTGWVGQVAGLGMPAFKRAAAMRPCWVMDAELISVASWGVSLMISARVRDSRVVSPGPLGVSAMLSVAVVTACAGDFAGRWAGTGQRCWRRENP